MKFRNGKWKLFLYPIGVVLFLLLFWKADVPGIAENAARFGLLNICLMTLMVLSTIPLRMLQLHLLLSNKDRVAPFSQVATAVLYGYVANAFLPMVAGDAVRAAKLYNAKTGPIRGIVGALLIVRLLDLLCLTIVAAAGAECAYNGRIEQGNFLLFVTIGTVAIAVGTCFLALLLRRFRFVSRYVTAAEPKRLFCAQLLAFTCWMILAAAPTPLLKESLSPSAARFVLTASIMAYGAFAQALPIAPAGVGTYHATSIFLIGKMLPDASYDFAFTYSVIVHMVGVFLPAMTALAILLIGGVVYSRIRRSQNGEPESFAA